MGRPKVTFVFGGRHVSRVMQSRSSLHPAVLCKTARSTWMASFPGAGISVELALELWLKDPAIALADTTEPTDVEGGWCGWSVFSQAPADGHALGRRPKGDRELADHTRKGS